MALNLYAVIIIFNLCAGALCKKCMDSASTVHVPFIPPPNTQFTPFGQAHGTISRRGNHSSRACGGARPVLLSGRRGRMTGLQTKLMIIVIPQDYALLETLDDELDTPPLKINMGTQLESDIIFLQEHGLVTVINVETDMPDECFPKWTPEPFHPGPSEPNIAARQKFHALPFRLLHTCNKAGSKQGIGLDPAITYATFLHERLRKCTMSVDNPLDVECNTLFICPAGGPIIGPLKPNTQELHHCFHPTYLHA
ncbi:hypothetical protein B0H21DRAFT_827174 [Amylocystis lapponica]|nr:hypothetical protein B0H21DRAFT_827174 [Amylocystis lapponica]